MYEPREDSEFLAGFVREHARGKVVDMGTGSGVLARAALENPAVEEVTAADADAEAVARLKGSPRIRAVHSDLFANLEGELFDTIVCNPPYLPDEEGDEDAALYGGPGGYEWIERFLQEARNHLAERGSILLLFSSLTNKERIDAAIKALKYRSEELGMLAMFFERLYVYRIWR